MLLLASISIIVLFLSNLERDQKPSSIDSTIIHTNPFKKASKHLPCQGPKAKASDRPPNPSSKNRSKPKPSVRPWDLRGPGT